MSASWSNKPGYIFVDETGPNPTTFTITSKGMTFSDGAIEATTNLDVVGRLGGLIPALKSAENDETLTVDNAMTVQNGGTNSIKLTSAEGKNQILLNNSPGTSGFVLTSRGPNGSVEWTSAGCGDGCIPSLADVLEVDPKGVGNAGQSILLSSSLNADGKIEVESQTNKATVRCDRISVLDKVTNNIVHLGNNGLVQESVDGVELTRTDGLLLNDACGNAVQLTKNIGLILAGTNPITLNKDNGLSMTDPSLNILLNKNGLSMSDPSFNLLLTTNKILLNGDAGSPGYVLKSGGGGSITWASESVPDVSTLLGTPSATGQVLKSGPGNSVVWANETTPNVATLLSVPTTMGQVLKSGSAQTLVWATENITDFPSGTTIQNMVLKSGPGNSVVWANETTPDVPDVYTLLGTPSAAGQVLKSGFGNSIGWASESVPDVSTLLGTPSATGQVLKSGPGNSVVWANETTPNVATLLSVPTTMGQVLKSGSAQTLVWTTENITDFPSGTTIQNMVLKSGPGNSVVWANETTPDVPDVYTLLGTPSAAGQVLKSGGGGSITWASESVPDVATLLSVPNESGQVLKSGNDNTVVWESFSPTLQTVCSNGHTTNTNLEIVRDGASASFHEKGITFSSEATFNVLSGPITMDAYSITLNNTVFNDNELSMNDPSGNTIKLRALSGVNQLEIVRDGASASFHEKGITFSSEATFNVLSGPITMDAYSITLNNTVINDNELSMNDPSGNTIKLRALSGVNQLLLNNSPGSQGQVLKSGGDGSMSWQNNHNIKTGVIQPSGTSGSSSELFMPDRPWYSTLPPVVSIHAVHSSNNIAVHVTSYNGVANDWWGFNFEWSGGEPTYITWMAILS